MLYARLPSFSQPNLGLFEHSSFFPSFFVPACPRSYLALLAREKTLQIRVVRVSAFVGGKCSGVLELRLFV